MHEAYRPPHSKYYFCCPIRGWGVSHPRTGVVPRGCSDLAGAPIGKDMGPEEVLWDGDEILPWVWTDKQTEPITFPHPSDAGGNKSKLIDLSTGCATRSSAKEFITQYNCSEISIYSTLDLQFLVLWIEYIVIYFLKVTSGAQHVVFSPGGANCSYFPNRLIHRSLMLLLRLLWLVVPSSHGGYLVMISWIQGRK